MKAKKVYEAIDDVLTPKELSPKEQQLINAIQQMYVISNDSSRSDSYNLQLIDDLLKKVDVSEHCLTLYAFLSMFNDGASPYDMLNNVRDVLQEFLTRLGLLKK